MLQKIGFLLLWLGFVAYAFLLAPPDNPETIDLITNLSSGNVEGINPYIVNLFNIMGILPLTYACLLIIDGTGQKLKSMPFVIGSFFVGAFALLPYLAFRQPTKEFTGEKSWLIKILDSRILGILLTGVCGYLIFSAITQGNWQDFVNQWQSSRFIHVMSLDFCLLCLLFPAVIGADLSKRNIENRNIFWAISLIPLFGTLIYLCLRPSLPVINELESIDNPDLSPAESN